jgi:hypothetical protein
MKKCLALLTCILCSLLLAGCASTGQRQSELIPLPDKPERVAFPGFSIVPPQGGGWFRAQSQDPRVAMYLATYLKRGPAAGHTISATVWSHSVPSSERGKFGIDQLVEAIRKKNEREDAGRFKVLSDNVNRVNFHGADCARADLVSEDRGVPGDEGRPYRFAMHMIICIHPKAPFYIIWLEYSQRTPPGVEPLDIRPAGEAFFDSLEFSQVDHD